MYQLNWKLALAYGTLGVIAHAQGDQFRGTPVNASFDYVGE